MAASSTSGSGRDIGGSGGGLAAGEMEVEAYRRLFPLPFYERHLLDSVRPDARPLHRARDTSIALGSAPFSIFFFSGMINLKELSLISGKAAWMAYLDIYCLNADGSLFDAALLSAISSFSHCKVSFDFDIESILILVYGCLTDCIVLTKHRMKELQNILEDSLSAMEVV
ncbi:hypothetical protein BHE74_00003169 [Ensete ventricosum]|nr:hypothetical protein GW17_00008432 [Ensete ventricosum]RWW87970.1 hypothetical protein BHE74_00003169 [Ensete ventricosum]RZR87803.1 hypothetical protein BHM03_00015274 [Ensete ventricosum]